MKIIDRSARNSSDAMSGRQYYRVENSVNTGRHGTVCDSRTKGLPVVPRSLERVVAHAKLKGVAQN
jgi:hypothetical protein